MTSSRDILVVAIVLVSLPFCLLRPWVGILMWSWLSYMNPHRLTWGFAYDFPFAQLVAVATLVGFVFTSDRKRFFVTREIVALVMLWLWFAVTTTFALYPESAWTRFNEFSKILLMALLVIPLFRDRQRLRILLLVIAGSLGFYGVKGGLFVLVTGGQWMVLGPPGSFFQANTELALVLNMALPVLACLAREETRLWVRRVLWATFFLTMLAVPFTYSRAGFLGLVVVLAMLFLDARRRLAVIMLAMVGFVAFSLFTPDHWVERIQTLQDPTADLSAQRRLASWQLSRNIAAEYPIVGGGFTVFWHRATYDMYLPEYPEGLVHDAHSIYFNLLGEHGYVGLGLFLVLISFALLRAQQLRRMARAHPEVAWASNYGRMIQASLATYLVTGTFLSVAYFDLAYQLMILAPLIHVVASAELAAAQAAPAETLPVPVTPTRVRAR